jgi:acetyl-CoA carboxylase biotin carboxyl carrier protein
MDLTEEDVLEILKLVEQSKFDYFQLEQGALKLTVARNGYVPAEDAPGVLAPPPVAAAPPAAPKAAAPGPAAPAAPAAIDNSLVAVTAPMVGTFYAAPAPTEPPFVEQGTQVDAGATLGLIEVMKVFTAIKAEVGGIVEAILVADAQFVEYGQPLFRIRPEGTP